MSTDHIDGEHNADILPLRAKDAGTETKVAEATGPAYTDLSDGRAQRKAIIPAHWRTWAAAREHVKLASGAAAYHTAWHGVRVPMYLVLTAWWALVGIGRTLAALLAWWHVPDLHKLERQAAEDGLLSDHLRIHKAGQGDEHRAGVHPARVRRRGGGRAGHPLPGPGVGVDPARRRRGAAARPHRAPGAQADRHLRHPPGHGAGPDPRTSSPARSGRSVSPGSTGGSATAARSCSRPRSVRTAPAGGPRSTCPTA